MRGSRAKKVRRLARRVAAKLNPQRPPVERCYTLAKRDWKLWCQRRAVACPRPVKPVNDRGGRKRLTLDERANAARQRGAAERAERSRLIAGDEWLAAQPWMSIQRLRRVAAKRKGATS